MNIKREFLHSENTKIIPFQLMTSNYGIVDGQGAPSVFNEGPVESREMKVEFPIESSSLAMLVDVGGEDKIVQVKSAPPGTPQVSLEIKDGVTYQIYVVSKEYVDGFVLKDFTVSNESIAGQRAEITYDDMPQSIDLGRDGAMSLSYGRDSGDTMQWYNYDGNYDGPLVWEAPAAFEEEQGNVPEIITRRDIYQDLLGFFTRENIQSVISNQTQTISAFKVMNDICTFIATNDNLIKRVLPDTYEQISALWEFISLRVPSQTYATYVAPSQFGIHQYVSQAAVWSEIVPIESDNYRDPTRNAQFLDPEMVQSVSMYDISNPPATYKPTYTLDSEFYGATKSLTHATITNADGTVDAGEAAIGQALKVLISDAHTEFDSQFEQKAIPRIPEFGTSADVTNWWIQVENDAQTFAEVYDELIVRMENVDEILGEIDWFIFLPDDDDTGGGDDDDDDTGGGDDDDDTGSNYGPLTRPASFNVTKTYNIETIIAAPTNRDGAAYGQPDRDWAANTPHSTVSNDVRNERVGYDNIGSRSNMSWDDFRNAPSSKKTFIDMGRVADRNTAKSVCFNFVPDSLVKTETETYTNEWIWNTITSPIPGQNAGQPWLPDNRDNWDLQSALSSMDLDGTEDIQEDGYEYYCVYASYLVPGRTYAITYYYRYKTHTSRNTPVQFWNDIATTIESSLDSFYPPTNGNKSFGGLTDNLTTTVETDVDSGQGSGAITEQTTNNTGIRSHENYYPVAHEATLQNIRFLKDLMNSIDENLWASYNTTSAVILSMLLDLKKDQENQSEKYTVLNITNSTTPPSNIEVLYKNFGGNDRIEAALNLAQDWKVYSSPLLEIGDGMLALNLGGSEFDDPGKYIFQIRPRKIEANIFSAETETGYLIVKDELNAYRDTLFGYNAQVYTADGHQKGGQKIVVDSRWKASYSYLKFSPTEGFDLQEDDKIVLWSGEFMPTTIEVDIVEHNALTLSYAAYAKKELNTNNGMCTIYDHNGNVYKELSFGRHSNAGTGGDIIEYRVPAEKDYTDEY